ncbi:MAG: C40 family peptidase [Chthoniobacterales bacterium]|nr:C40 family peptidase [Chthoniobacterales bacterium]
MPFRPTGSPCRCGLCSANAPLSVKRAIWAADTLLKKPYRWGGGHATFFDRGYDCSGTVSYALTAAGLLRVPMNSKELPRFGNRGHGKWITVFARNGHAFASSPVSASTPRPGPVERSRSPPLANDRASAARDLSRAIRTGFKSQTTGPCGPVVS